MNNIYKSFLINAFLIILILHSSIYCKATTYYVSNKGSDSNSGLSITLSWKTLAKINFSTFSAGDSVLFNCGNIFNGQLRIPSSGISENPITYSKYGTGINPVIDANYAYDKCIKTTGKSYITIDGIDCIKAREFGIGTAFSPGHHITIKNLTISEIGNDNSESVGIYQKGGYCTITNCIITNTSQNAIQFEGGNNLIMYNNISYTNARYTGWGAGIAGNGNNDEICYNVLANNGGVGEINKTHGIYIGIGTTNANVHHNILFNSTRGAGIKTNGSGDFHHNYIRISLLAGIAVGFNKENVVVLNIYQNLFTGNRSGISQTTQGSGAFTLKILNNTFYCNNNTKADSYYSEISINDNINTSLIIKNNILFGEGRYTYAFNTEQSHATINNNCVYQTLGSLIYYAGFAKTWTDWQALGFDTNGINANPLLVSPYSDFSLQSNSPVINKGVNVGLTTDYNGKPIVGLPDMGAFESDNNRMLFFPHKARIKERQ